MPNVDLNWIAIVVAVIVSFALGSVWYGVLVRDAWQRAMGYTGEFAPPTSEVIRGSLINIVGSLLMAYVLAWLVGAWMSAPTAAGAPPSWFMAGLVVGIFAWLGFIVPTFLSAVAYERKSWTLFGINAAFQLVSTVVMALIIAFWR